MTGKPNVLVVAIALIALAASVGYGQDDPFTGGEQTSPRRIRRPAKSAICLEGGVSSLVGDGSEYWNTGFAVGGCLLYRVMPGVLLGGRVGYNRWTPNEEELTKPYEGLGINWDVSGSATSIEIAPIVRVTQTPGKGRKVSFFGQFGFGIFMIDIDGLVEAWYMGEYVAAEVKVSENKAGLSFGGGLIIGDEAGIRFEVFPKYTVVLTEVESTKYIALNIGVVVGL